MKMNKKRLGYCAVASLLIGLFNITSADAQSQSVPGGGNQNAVELSRKSPMVQSAYHFLITQAEKVGERKLRSETMDAISNTDTCVQHRAGLAESDKNRILQNLINAGLVDLRDDATFPGGLKAGIFPPVLNEGAQCPHLPQRFFSAPGSNFGGHHSYPGGLPIHEANNDIADVNLANEYRKVYGYSYGGLATLNPTHSGDLLGENYADIFIDENIILAAPIWHDWAKSIVFQWKSDGSEFQELSFGGNGVSDNYGSSGNSKTGAHHILSIAEAMKRSLSPAFVITQASAHSAPTLGNEFKVVNWLRAAAIIATIDSVQKGYLTKDAEGHLRLPALRKLGGIDLLKVNPSETNLLVEYTIHNLSDADFTYSMPAVTSVQAILQELAPSFGFSPADTADYNNHFRNPVLSFFTGERLLILYSEKGLTGVRTELQKLREKKIIEYRTEHPPTGKRLDFIPGVTTYTLDEPD